MGGHATDEGTYSFSSSSSSSSMISMSFAMISILTNVYPLGLPLNRYVDASMVQQARQLTPHGGTVAHLGNRVVRGSHSQK